MILNIKRELLYICSIADKQSRLEGLNDWFNKYIKIYQVEHTVDIAIYKHLKDGIYKKELLEHEKRKRYLEIADTMYKHNIGLIENIGSDSIPVFTNRLTLYILNDQENYICALCVELTKGKLTPKEIARAFLEINFTGFHLVELIREISKYYDDDEITSEIVNIFNELDLD